jgi:hypothetical protein
MKPTTMTTEEPWGRLRPVTFEETCELFRKRFDGREHWMFVLDAESNRILVTFEEKYYSPNLDDLDVALMEFEGIPFVLVAARKKRMLAWRLGSLLRQLADVRLSEREIVARDCLIVTRQHLQEIGLELALSIFQDKEKSPISVQGIAIGTIGQLRN